MNEQTNKPGSQSKKLRYEAPKATCVRVQVEERLAGCLFTTIRVCGLTE